MVKIPDYQPSTTIPESTGQVMTQAPASQDLTRPIMGAVNQYTQSYLRIKARQDRVNNTRIFNDIYGEASNLFQNFEQDNDLTDGNSSKKWSEVWQQVVSEKTANYSGSQNALSKLNERLDSMGTEFSAKLNTRINEAQEQAEIDDVNNTVQPFINGAIDGTIDIDEALNNIYQVVSEKDENGVYRFNSLTRFSMKCLWKHQLIMIHLPHPKHLCF